jgi:cysteine dioxygenase
MAVGIFSNYTALGVGPSMTPNVGPRQQNRFEELVQRLKDALGPSSGLTSDDVDVDYLQQLMEGYDSSNDSWSKYAFGDRTRGYTRNLVDEGNGKSNLVRHPSQL